MGQQSREGQPLGPGGMGARRGKRGQGAPLPSGAPLPADALGGQLANSYLSSHGPAHPPASTGLSPSSRPPAPTPRRSTASRLPSRTSSRPSRSASSKVVSCRQVVAAGWPLQAGRGSPSPHNAPLIRGKFCKGWNRLPPCERKRAAGCCRHVAPIKVPARQHGNQWYQFPSRPQLGLQAGRLLIELAPPADSTPQQAASPQGGRPALSAGPKPWSRHAACPGLQGREADA